MDQRRFFSLSTAALFLFANLTVDLRASAASRPISETRPHVVSSQALHQAVLTSHEQTAEARESVKTFLDRTDVRQQIERLGLSPERMMSRVADLNDAELLRLQEQVMEVELQEQTAGLSTGAIIAIVALGVGGSILLLLLLASAADPLYYY